MSAGKTAVVDYGLCNIDSMVRALEECGARDVEATNDPRTVVGADRIVLPGVGTFEAGMRNLVDRGLDVAIREACERGNTPLLGACLGMQLLGTRGYESGNGEPVAGLGLVEGDVVKLEPASRAERLPHIGWNEVHAREGSVLFESVAEARDFYFVHSFHVRLADGDLVCGETPFAGSFTAAFEVADRAIFGTQFHPEKSQRNGFRLLRNFLAV